MLKQITTFYTLLLISLFWGPLPSSWAEDAIVLWKKKIQSVINHKVTTEPVLVPAKEKSLDEKIQEIFEGVLLRYPTSQLQNLLHDSRRAASLSQEEYALDYLIRFFISRTTKEYFIAVHQGKSLMRTSLPSLLTPPQLEFFMSELNRSAKLSDTVLPEEYSFPPSGIAYETILKYSRLYLSMRQNTLVPGLLATQKPDFYLHLLRSDYLCQPSVAETGRTSFPAKASLPTKTISLALLKKEQRLEMAVHEAKKALEIALFPFQSVLALMQMKRLYETLNRKDAILDILNKMNEVHPSSSNHLMLAAYFREIKDWKQMDYHNKLALKLNPAAKPVSAPVPHLTESKEPPLLPEKSKKKFLPQSSSSELHIPKNIQSHEWVEVMKKISSPPTEVRLRDHWRYYLLLSGNYDSLENELYNKEHLITEKSILSQTSDYLSKDGLPKNPLASIAALTRYYFILPESMKPLATIRILDWIHQSHPCKSGKFDSGSLLWIRRITEEQNCATLLPECMRTRNH
jgi:tetratricopeptide (TPR) repeat protein